MLWTQALEESIEHPGELKELLHLDTKEQTRLAEIVAEYPMRVPAYYLALIDPEDESDPIRRMSIPGLLEDSPGGVADTSGEHENTILPGMQHKYPQTVMILSNNQCAMYCRHCFRKRMVGLQDEDECAQNIAAIADYVRNHHEINNVLISGGDALMNSTEKLREFFEILAAMDHVDFIRLGTRIPVVLPQRITDDEALLALLAEFNVRKQIFVVTQFNHPRELTPEALAGVAALRRAGCVLRNQTVLLRGVNDEPAVLARLMNELTKLGVIPYYIFQCRPARGVKNQFQVSLPRSAKIVSEAKKQMSGQAKSVRHAMSHVSGKIEILGLLPDGQLLFKYHQAKDAKNTDRIFSRHLGEEDGWLQERIIGD